MGLTIFLEVNCTISKIYTFRIISLQFWVGINTLILLSKKALYIRMVQFLYDISGITKLVL